MSTTPPDGPAGRSGSPHARWVMRDWLERPRRSAASVCRYCGTAQRRDCQIVTCMLCGTPQCHANGLGNGCCKVCSYGYLPGWGRSAVLETCGYAKCDNTAVAQARNRPVCTGHTQRIKPDGKQTLAEWVAEQLAHRDAGKGWEHWRLVE